MFRNILLLLFVLGLLASGCSEVQESEETIAAVGTEKSTGNITAGEEIQQSGEEGDMAGKKILMVIAPTGFRDEEFFEPKAVFEKNNISVTVASKGVATAKGKLGATSKVDIEISEANAKDYDAVVFVGGPGAAVYFSDPAALKLASDFYSAGKVTAAICIGPSVLANAGVLKTHKATAFESEKDNITEKSKGYTGDEVTVDGKVVTANGPGAATGFGKAVADLLK